MPKSRPPTPADEMAKCYLRRAKPSGARKAPVSEHPSPRTGSGRASRSSGPGTPDFVPSTASLGTVPIGAESRGLGTVPGEAVPSTPDDRTGYASDRTHGDRVPGHGGAAAGQDDRTRSADGTGSRSLASERLPAGGPDQTGGTDTDGDEPGRLPADAAPPDMGTPPAGQAAAATPSRTTGRARGARARVLAQQHVAAAVHEPVRKVADGAADGLSGPFAALIAERVAEAPARATAAPPAEAPPPERSGSGAAEAVEDVTARVRNERADILLRMLREAGPTLPLEGVLAAFKLSAATRPSRLRERVLEPIARLLEDEGWTVAMDVSTARKTVTVTLARNGVPEPLGAGSERTVPGADDDVPDPFDTQLGEPLDGFLGKLLAEGVAGSGSDAPPPDLSGGRGGQDAAAVGTLSERGGSGRTEPSDTSVDRAGDGPIRHGPEGLGNNRRQAESDLLGNDRRQAESGVPADHGSDPSGNGRRDGGTGEIFPVDFDPPREPPGPGTRFAIRRPASLSGRPPPPPAPDAAQASPVHAAAPETHRSATALFDDIAAGSPPPAVETVPGVSATASRPVPSDQARALLGALFREDDEDGEPVPFAAVPAPAPAPAEAPSAPVSPAEPAPAGGGVFAELLRREQEAGLQASEARPAGAAMPVPSAPPPDRRAHDPAAAPPQPPAIGTVPAPAPPPAETASAPPENTGAAVAFWPALDAATLAALGVLAGGLAVALLFPLGGAAAAALSPVAAGITWWLARQDSGSALPMTVVAVIVALAFTAERHQVAALRMALLQIQADLGTPPP